jgi:hypothetical protein
VIGRSVKNFAVCSLQMVVRCKIRRIDAFYDVRCGGKILAVLMKLGYARRDLARTDSGSIAVGRGCPW